MIAIGEADAARIARDAPVRDLPHGALVRKLGVGEREQVGECFG
jgi:hypothetical protein